MPISPKGTSLMKVEVDVEYTNSLLTTMPWEHTMECSVYAAKVVNTPITEHSSNGIEHSFRLLWNTCRKRALVSSRIYSTTDKCSLSWCISWKSLLHWLGEYIYTRIVTPSPGSTLWNVLYIHCSEKCILSRKCCKTDITNKLIVCKKCLKTLFIINLRCWQICKAFYTNPQ